MLKHICHYREAPDSPQWDEEFDTKAAADDKALQVFLNGGIAIVTEVEVADPVQLSVPMKDQDHE